MKEIIQSMDHQQLIDYYEKIEAIATRDSLTGLFTRGELERLVGQKLRDMTTKDSCALFIVDLDNFKVVNDTLGHQTGDHVLGRAAKLLSGMCRAADIVGRLGGDEFVIFLYGNITEDIVRERAQMICDQLQLLLSGDKEICVTASLGVRMAEGEGHTFEQMYHLADMALYKAKKSGKQGYCIYTKDGGWDYISKMKYTPANAIRLRGLLDYIDSGVAMVQMKKRPSFLYVSPAFARMLGMEAGELVQTSLEEIVYPKDVCELEGLLRDQVMEDNQAVSHVFRVMAKDGAMMWWRGHAVRVEYDEKIPVVLLTVTDISELKEQESSLRENNNLFQIALNQNMQGIWEVEFSTRTFRMMGGADYFHGGLMKPADFPQALIESGWISVDSMEEFRAFAEEVYSGRSQGYGNFRIKYKDIAEHKWASFSYRTVQDENGSPIRAVGIIEMIDQEKKGKGADIKGTMMPDGLMSSLVAQLVINLTMDKVINFWIEGREIRRGTEEFTFSKAYKMGMERVFLPEHTSGTPRALSREGLMKAFLEQEKRWMVYEYQRTDETERVGWVSAAIHLYQDPDNEDIHMAVWVSRIDQKRRWERELGVGIFKDPLSKLYTHSTVRKMASALMEEKKSKLSALILVEISGFSRLYAMDTSKKEKSWRAVLAALTLAAGASCIPGQRRKDQFVLFYPEIASEEDIRRRIEQMVLFVRNITSDLGDAAGLRFLVGGVTHRGEEDDSYDMLLRRAELITSRWRNTSGDRIAFAGGEEEKNCYQLMGLRDEDKIRTGDTEVPRPLSEREKNAAFTCLLSLLNADSLEECSRNILSALGEYYEADRTYILVIVEHGHIVTMPHEWTSSGKISIQQAISGSLVSHFPLLMRCAREKKPVFLERRDPEDKRNKKREKKGRRWNFAVFPMEDGESIQGYLCIENARIHALDAALPPLLGECLLKERKRYLKSLGAKEQQVGISGMNIPNFSAYMETIYSFHSDAYHALGAVCLDVPALSAINERQGFEYGRKLLWYIIQTMTDIFGRSMLFRTWDAEFVALCPNTTKEVFRGRCARLRAVLSRRYPRETRMGHTWSDHDFTGKALVDEAREMMRRDKSVGVWGVESLRPSPYQENDLYGKGKISTETVTLYLQPRFHHTTGELTGVVGILQGIGEDGSLTDSSAYLEELKRRGFIRDMDLFLLDKAMYALEEWKKSGLLPVPMTISISEETLFHRTALASFLAVQSRYPLADQGMLKIRIREKAPRHKWDQIQEAERRLHSSGIGFVFAAAESQKKEEGMGLTDSRLGLPVPVEQFLDQYAGK